MIRHTHVLKPSRPDDVALCTAVEDKFLTVCGLYRRTHGTDVPIPESLDADMLRWRQMRVRHKRGDFRHTEAELKSTQTIAQWTLDMNCDMRGQPRKQMQWQS